MPASPEQFSRATDPATTAGELQQLAAADRDLWPTIAAHPNVYPDLIDWMRANGFDETATPDVPDVPVGAEPSSPTEPAPPAEPQPEPVAVAPTSVLPDPLPGPVPPTAPTSPAIPRAAAAGAWFARHRTKVLAIGGSAFAAVLALVLVLTLVVAPQQAAAEAAAKALASAIEDYDDIVAKCENANTAHDRAVAAAEKTTAVDPATMTEPALLDDLQVAIATAEADAVPCEAPAMATETAEIEAQTDDIRVAVNLITGVTSALTQAVDDVEASVAARADEIARAEREAAAAAAAAEAAARTWTLTDQQGFSFTASLKIDAPVTSLTTGEYSLGDSCGFDPSVDVAVPVTLTVTATTQGFDTPISVMTILNQRSRPATPHEVVIEGYFSDGPSCRYPATTGGSMFLHGVSWNEPFETGKGSSHRFVVIIRDWRTPSTPDGDLAFLDTRQLYIQGGGQGTSYTASGGHNLTLSNQAVR